jgi:hypothetical protein
MQHGQLENEAYQTRHAFCGSMPFETIIMVVSRTGLGVVLHNLYEVENC